MNPLKSEFQDIILAHCSRYPLMQMADLYKMAHQAAKGPGHLVASRRQAGQNLVRELSGIEPAPDADLLEKIAPGNRVIRVNLRPFLAAGNDAGKLTEVFYQSARQFTEQNGQLEDYGGILLELAGSGKLPFNRDEWSAFWIKKARENFPVGSHSEPYRRAYKPAYRIVLNELIKDFF